MPKLLIRSWLKLKGFKKKLSSKVVDKAIAGMHPEIKPEFIPHIGGTKQNQGLVQRTKKGNKERMMVWFESGRPKLFTESFSKKGVSYKRKADYGSSGKLNSNSLELGYTSPRKESSFVNKTILVKLQRMVVERIFKDAVQGRRLVPTYGLDVLLEKERAVCKVSYRNLRGKDVEVEIILNPQKQIISETKTVHY